MDKEDCLDIAVSFDKCQDGWIDFTVRVGDGSVQLHASEVFDPFRDLVSWMEAILTDVQKCSFGIDEEGQGKEFIAHRNRDDKVFFEVKDTHTGEVVLAGRVFRYQLISAFYKGMRKFVLSPAYKRDEWSEKTLWEHIQQTVPDPSRENVVDEFAHLSGQQLHELLVKIAPMYQVSFPGEASRNDEFHKFVEHVLDPDNPDKKRGMVRTPVGWEVPVEFDQWPYPERRKFVEECLDSRLDSSRGGCRLDQLRSARIEAFLVEAAHGKISS